MRLAIILLVVVTGSRPADACMCSDPRPFLSGTMTELDPDPTLFLFVPEEVAPYAAEKVTATQDGAQVTVTDEVIHHVAEYTVRRIQLRGTKPGKVVVHYLRDGHAEALTIGKADRTPWKLMDLEYEGTGTYCGQALRFQLVATGAASVYRATWRQATGSPIVAYFPASARHDKYGVPLSDGHAVDVGVSGCGTKWVQPELLHDPDTSANAELVLIDHAGADHVLGRGRLHFDGSRAALPALGLATPAPPVQPQAQRAFAWAPLGIGVAIGLVLGVLPFVLRRRRA